MIASLPMYDLPPLEAAHDRLWTGIIDTLGFGPPALTRGGDPWEAWLSPDLVLSQTCGFPYRARLHGKVQLVGTPDYGLKGCRTGHYNSVIIARKTDRISDIHELAGKRFAFNEPLSQSGWAAPKAHLDGLGIPFGQLVQTGGHALSAKTVAEGSADFAAIDAQTWRLLQRHSDTPGLLAEVARTEPTPALPFITALGRDAGAIRSALTAASGALSTADQDALCIRSIVQIPAEDYLAVPIPDAPKL